MLECLIKSGKKDDTENATEVKSKGRQHLCIRHQNGEYMLQSSFPRIKDCFKFKEYTGEQN
jgi:hypothetical protein